MIDIEAIKGRIANGIYGDDRLTGAEVLDALAALDALVAEIERLRGENAEDARRERAAVVAWLREEAEPSPQSFTVRGKEWAKRIDDIADFIERGEHRREEEP
jgi:hypothetical protein